MKLLRDARSEKCSAIMGGNVEVVGESHDGVQHVTMGFDSSFRFPVEPDV